MLQRKHRWNPNLCYENSHESIPVNSPHKHVQIYSVEYNVYQELHQCMFALCGMGLLPDTQNRGLRMRRECRERFPRHRIQRKLLVSDPGMHHGTCVTHVPWCMSGSLNCGSDGKRSQDSRRMRNSQFYVSGKRPMGKSLLCVWCNGSSMS